MITTGCPSPEPGKGTRFVVESRWGSEIVIPKEKRAAMTRCLIVDDEESNRYMLETLLGGNGYETIAAENGAVALTKARKHPPDLVVSDILMPVMDGYRLCKEWKADPVLKQIPFVFYTATYTETKDEAFALSLGAERFILKPQEPEVLLNVLRETLAEKVKEKEAAEPPIAEMEFLKQHNEKLWRKLDKKLSELEQNNRELKAFEETYRLSFENVSDVIFTVDADLMILSISPSVTRILGYKPQDFVGRPVGDLAGILTPESFSRAMADVNPILKGETVQAAIYQFVARNGAIKIGEVNGSPIIRDGQVTGMVCIARDITERKRAEQALRDSEGRFEAQYRGSPIAMFTWERRDDDFILTSFNERARAFAAGPIESFIGRKVSELYADRPEIPRNMHRCYDERGIIRMEDNSEHFMPGRLVVITFVFVPANLIIVHLEDVTERRKAEEALRESELKYRGIFENAQEGICHITPARRFVIANPAMARIFGYDTPEELISEVTDIGHQLCAHHEEFARLVAEVEKRGFARDHEIKALRKDGSTICIYCTMRAVRDDQGRIIYYEGIIQDMTDRKKSVELLKEALDGTVRAIAALVETKDPYTAGHQRHVGDLAGAIAKEMGLAEEVTEGLRIAGMIHDIGKISVPAEILSMPRKLTEIEMSLIKSHPQSGYDILKDIDFPWPVAQIVLQHHERLDGSGYPLGLKGSEIMPEVRILAVADVVEAIVSHRPYRPALGLNLAIDEISKNRGILYDPDVVAACLKLLTNNQYILAA